MLCQFTFSNYRSFRNEAFLDLCAENISEMKETLITRNGDDFLPVVSIYGPNGGGKSTVIEALAFLRNAVINPFLLIKSGTGDLPGGFKDRVVSAGEQKSENGIYFKFDETGIDTPTEFELLFMTSKHEFKYEFSLLRNDIVKENLYCRSLENNSIDAVFERSNEHVELGEDLAGLPLEKIRKSMPLLSYGAAIYSIESIDDAISWFLHIMILDYNNPISDYTVGIHVEENDLKQFIKMLQAMDINITGIREEKDDKGNLKNLYTAHAVNGHTYELGLQEESSGTRKILNCLSMIIASLKGGLLVLADELDAKLHPKLLRYLIELYKDPSINKNGSQLILTSHDMVNMDSEVFRRDEIWFCSLRLDNSSNLYSLVSFIGENGHKVRKDESYCKRYLEGLYGADPYIKKGLEWGGSNEQ